MEEPGRPRRQAWAVFAIAFAALALTTDDRFFGGIGDGKEMLSASWALAHFGEMGISRQFLNAAPRPGGDGFSRYGMGTSFVEVLPMLLARAVRSALPSAPTAPLFVLVPILSLAATAVLLARSAALLGAGPLLAGAAGLAAVFSSPVWGYAGTDFSEPIQVAALSLLLCSVLTLRRLAPSSRGWEIVAGASAAFAVLTKSTNILPVTLLLLPVVWRPAPAPKARPSRARKGGARSEPRLVLAGTFAAGLGLWAALELVRFGKLFGGYPGEDFAYPFFTGLLRLTVFPNKGLLVYAPLLLLVPWGLSILWRADRVLAASLAAAASSYFLISSAWWAWDGQSSWGPRLVLPAVPILFLLAWPALEGAGRKALVSAAVLAAAGLVVNLPGALYPIAGPYALALATDPQPIPAARAEGTPYEIYRQPDGTLTATGPHHLSLSPSWWPPLFHARLIAELGKGGDVAGRLRDGALGHLSPPFLLKPPGDPSPTFELATAPFRWPFWGRSWIRPPARPIDPYGEAMEDQLARAVATGNRQRAEALRKALLLSATARQAAPADR